MIMLGQSKWHSAIESVANIAVGFAVAMIAQIIVLPIYFDQHISIGGNMQIAAWFTVISLVRSYAMRRVFNAWHVSKTEYTQ